MLKRLELVGFKSFADRTWFDFPAGLTAIVGPNGSGKSNIVDAVKWILGEQSAKSLRGGEMADVIFNGSATRKALGLAEVTMTFDNSLKVLNSEHSEVSVGRRVYRDGTGEYLINGQVQRLKDVKELFLGSGAGSTAYCIIEQGRVDALLQASTRDRRAIIEEAAGISRFKAKKLETLRKLEHTEENLTRLRDILGEVEGRLRRVRLDAEKAVKYREYSSRLQELRLGLSLREYGELTAKLDESNATLEALKADMGESQIQVAVWESELKDLDLTLSNVEQSIARAGEGQAEARRRIAALQERQNNEAGKTRDAESELLIARKRTIELTQLLHNMQETLQAAGQQLQEAEQEAILRQQRAEELDAAAAGVERELTQLRQTVREGRDQQFHLVGRSATLNSEAAGFKSQLDKFQRDRERKRREADSKTAELSSVTRVLETLGQRDNDLQNRLGLARQALHDRRQERDFFLRQAQEEADQLEDLRVRHSGLKGRMEVLENLERSQEGLNTGVREVLAELSTRASKLSQSVIGLVADSLRVPRDVAPLIDIALGDVASHFVVRDPGLLDQALRERTSPFSGRVGFLPKLETEPLAQGDETITADRWVTCDHPELIGLPRQLLGRTLICDDLAAARRLATDPELHGFRFVTRGGELLQADGALSVGVFRAETGILSRKSELRDLREQAASLARDITETEQRIAELRESAQALAGPIHGLEEEIRILTSNAADVQTEMLKQQQQQQRLVDDLALIRQEREMLDEEIGRVEAFWKETLEAARDAEQQAEQLKSRIETAEQSIREIETSRITQQQEQTAARVALAEITQRRTAQRDAYRKLQADLERGQSEIERVARHREILGTRIVDSQLQSLKASAGLAEAFRMKEGCERTISLAQEERDASRARKANIQSALQSARGESGKKIEMFHARELASRDLENARHQVVMRLQDEYQIDLAQEYAASPLSRGEPLPGEWNGPQAAKDVEDLRKKIRQLGSVSLESLQELNEVEARANDLQTQMADLVEAEKSLRSIIEKINADSRKLFAETYEAVRGHFQELFRKLFGGGMADVILENPEDVLETGIEIVARPPGKELRSISLMSGGEKTLTAVALLLAIFRSKPSPFCLLDEVDAALDEANTERLASTLREFTDRSQFIIITHKKRTMAQADVLYGITMQESGISRQIAVRFDDWPDDTPEAA